MSVVKLDDILFYSSLIGCMALGKIYKNIEDPETKKGFGTGVGILIACLVCGNQVMHSFLMVWSNVVIIRCCDKKYVHQLSLGYTWLHLIYIHLRSGTSTYALWIQQILALRLVGLAFEIYRWDNSSRPTPNLNTIGDEWKNGPDKETVINNADPAYLTEKNSFFLMLTPMEIISYAFFFIGIHKGPYYRWKIFYDHFNAPFGVLGDCRVITEKKLKKALLCLIGIAVLRVKYPGDVYYKEEFYSNYGTDYRFLYNMSQLMIYCLHYQFVTILCTAVCSETGFGVYPARCKALPGFGPSTNFELLKTASTNPEVAIELEYNFSMLKCFVYEKLLIGPKMRDTLRSWDMPTRYWFWANVYKSCTKSTTEVRSGLAYMAWMIWVGPSIQQIIISSTLWLYVQLESEYGELYNTDEESIKVPWDIGFSIMRIFCLIYLTPCLIMKDYWAVIRYYNSIYWIYHFVLSAFLITVVVVYWKGRRHRVII